MFIAKEGALKGKWVNFCNLRAKSPCELKTIICLNNFNDERTSAESRERIGEHRLWTQDNMHSSLPGEHRIQYTREHLGILLKHDLIEDCNDDNFTISSKGLALVEG